MNLITEYVEKNLMEIKKRMPHTTGNMTEVRENIVMLVIVFFIESTHMCILLRACNLSPFSPCLTGTVDYPFASRHKGPGFKSPGGYLCETGIFLLGLSRYIGDPDVIDHHCDLI